MPKKILKINDYNYEIAKKFVYNWNKSKTSASFNANLLSL